MLYLRNTNQIQSLAQQVVRGPAGVPPEPPVTSSYFNGLGRAQWSVGFGAGGQPPITASSFVTSSIYWTPPIVVDSGSLQPSFLEPGSVTTGSAQWTGYFKPSTTETYSFYLFDDDYAAIWIGNAATASAPLTASALLQAGTVLGFSATGSISLTSGSLVPMLVWYTAHAAFDYFTASFSTPTITKTTDFTGYTFCNTASLGF